MGSKSACCCCSKCGVSLPKAHENCCLCACDKLCVRVMDLNPLGTGTDPCRCDSKIQAIFWDPLECAYTGTIVCADLSIDVRFDIKDCNNIRTGTGTGSGASDCYLCLTSSCLDLNGECPDNFTGTGEEPCKAIAPGVKTGDCGKYLKDCDQSGGFNQTWVVDANDCRLGTAGDCPSIEINVQCYPRINPAGEGIERICKDCDCVCECLQISYAETMICTGQSTVCLTTPAGTGTGTGNPGWETTFECSSGDQTVIILLFRGEDGCCYWDISISKGTFITVGTGTGATSIAVKTDCPEINLELDIDLGDLELALLNITCAPCESACNDDCWLLFDDILSVSVDVDLGATGCPCIESLFTVEKTTSESNTACLNNIEIDPLDTPIWSGSIDLCTGSQAQLLCFCFAPCEVAPGDTLCDNGRSFLGILKLFSISGDCEDNEPELKGFATAICETVDCIITSLDFRFSFPDLDPYCVPGGGDAGGSEIRVLVTKLEI